MQPSPLPSPFHNTTPPVVNAAAALFRSQVAAGIGVSGLLSLFGSLTIIFFVVKGKLYTKLHTRIVLYLSMSDFIQSFAGMSSFAWIHVDAHLSSMCTFQSVMFEFGDNASSFASATIATFVFVTVNSFDLQKRFGNPGKKFEIIALFFIFGLPLIFTFIGFMREVATGRPLYTPVGFNSWCWVSTSYPVERMMIHYTWILLIALYLILIYSYLGYTFCKSLRTAANSTISKKRQRLVFKMIGFPIIFLIVFVPLGLERFVTVISTAPGLTPIAFPLSYVAFAIVIFTSNGFWNALYYGYTRKIYKAISQSGSSSTTGNRSTSATAPAP